MASFGDYNRVNTNVTAMDAQLSLNKINRDLGESRLRLSTGFKINNAEDDAAGFAIATKLKSRVAGLEQALQNVSDAKSVLGIVEAAYGSIMDNLIEMKTLATQGANDTLGSTERGYIDSQLQSLAADINAVADSTKFQGIGLLDGNNATDVTNTTSDFEGSYTMTVQAGEGTTDTYAVTLNAVNVATLFGVADPEAGNATYDTGGDGTIQIAATLGAADGSEARGVMTLSNTTSADLRAFMANIDTAIGNLNGYMNGVGIDQRSLSGKEVNLTEAITANSAAQSRIMDTDFAKEQSNSIRLQILQQTATAALSQANMGPQAVLGFLG
jgi:flagellin